MKIPHYTLDPDKHMGTLVENFTFETPITGYVAAASYVVLDHNGGLLIRAGYSWDFGSGPAIDTPAMVASSLCHDAFYDLLRADQLPRKERRRIDRYFRKLLKAYGVGWFRRTYCYLAVRLGGGFSAN